MMAATTRAPAFLTTCHLPAMSSSGEKKQEADYTKEVDALIATAESLAAAGQLQEALDQVYMLEKKARNAADLSSTTRLLLLSLHLLRTTPSASSPNWDQLTEAIVSLSRKHGQLKQAITRMVSAAMCYLHPPGVGESGKSDEENEVEMKEAERVEEERREAEKAAEAKKLAEGGEAATNTKGKKEKMKEAVDGAMEDKGEGKENEGVRVLMDKAKAVGDTGVTEQMRLKLVETIRHVTEGKVRACGARAWERSCG